MNNPTKIASRFYTDDKGSAGPVFALMLMPMAMIIGCAVDYGMALKIRGQLRTAADAGAIAAASLSSTTSKDARETLAKNSTKANLPSDMGASVSADFASPRITVTASKAYQTSFLRMASINELNLSATAVAESTTAAATEKICILGLDPDSTDGIHIQGTNTADYTGCWGHTNSTKATALNANGSNAKAIGLGHSAVGGLDAPFDNFSPTPKTGQSAVADPYAETSAYPTRSSYVPKSMAAAPYMPSSCKQSGLKLKKGTYTLDPGRYCNGLTIMAQATVVLNPGIYIVDNGTFDVQSGASVSGSNVVFYYSGAAAKFQVIGGGTVNLSGRKAGQSYEGFLMIASANSSPGETSRVQGGSNFKVEGVIYAPTQRIEVGGESNANQDSKYFGIVAKDLYLIGNGKFYFRPHQPASELPDILPLMPKTGGARLI